MNGHQSVFKYRRPTRMNEFLYVHLSTFLKVTFIKHQRSLKQHLSVLLYSSLKRKLDIFPENVNVHLKLALQIFHFINVHSLKFTLKGICSSFYSKRTPFKYSVFIHLELLSITILVNLKTCRKLKILLK